MASRKLLVPSVAVYQDGRGSEPMIEVGSVTLAEALYIWLSLIADGGSSSFVPAPAGPVLTPPCRCSADPAARAGDRRSAWRGYDAIQAYCGPAAELADRGLSRVRTSPARDVAPSSGQKRRAVAGQPVPPTCRRGGGSRKTLNNYPPSSVMPMRRCRRPPVILNTPLSFWRVTVIVPSGRTLALFRLSAIAEPASGRRASCRGPLGNR